jgi:hypothetical protein
MGKRRHDARRMCTRPSTGYTKARGGSYSSKSDQQMHVINLTTSSASISQYNPRRSADNAALNDTAGGGVEDCAWISWDIQGPPYDW